MTDETETNRTIIKTFLFLIWSLVCIMQLALNLQLETLTVKFFGLFLVLITWLLGFLSIAIFKHREKK